MFLQSGTEVVTKWDRCYKVRRKLLQSGAGVTKWNRSCCKVGQVLQSGTILKKWVLTEVKLKSPYFLRKYIFFYNLNYIVKLLGGLQ